MNPASDPSKQINTNENLRIEPVRRVSMDNPPLEVVNRTFVEYYFQTYPGYSDGRTKTNQDSVYINIDFKMAENLSVFAVFDGHGTLGHKVSDYLKKCLTGNLKLNQAALELRIDHKKDYEESDYVSILEAVCLEINTKLVNNRSINSWFSGSTGIIVLLHNEKIVCANVGDSRAGIVKNSVNEGASLLKLSTDHTPVLPGEKQRIIKAGGKVMPCTGSQR